ncbi:MAG: tetratricopeptide repeat protein [Methanotrichaceae archaeon]
MQEDNARSSAESEIDNRSFLKNDFRHSLRDIDDILSIIDSEIEKNPESWEALGAKADILYSMTLYSQAVHYCDLSLGLNPDNPLVLIIKGDAMLKLGRHEEAMSCYYRSIELEPLYTKECYLRGLAVEEPKPFDGQPSNASDQLRLENIQSKSEIERLRHNMELIQNMMYLKDKEIDLLRNQAAFASNNDNEKCLQTDIGGCVRILGKKDIMKSTLM